jgi:hypothetical protein
VRERQRARRLQREQRQLPAAVARFRVPCAREGGSRGVALPAGGVTPALRRGLACVRALPQPGERVGGAA